MAKQQVPTLTTVVGVKAVELNPETDNIVAWLTGAEGDHAIAVPRSVVAGLVIKLMDALQGDVAQASKETRGLDRTSTKGSIQPLGVQRIGFVTPTAPGLPVMLRVVTPDNLELHFGMEPHQLQDLRKLVERAIERVEGLGLSLPHGRRPN